MLGLPPVVVFAIDADKEDAHGRHAPEQHAYPIDAIEREALHDRDTAEADEHNQVYHQQCTDDEPIHIVPRCPNGER